MKKNRIMLLCLSAILSGIYMPSFAQDKENKIGVYYTIDAGINPAFMISKNPASGNTKELNTMSGYNGRFGIYITDGTRTNAGLFAGIGVYENRSEKRRNALSAMYTGRFGLSTNTIIHKKGNHRMYWTQDVGASYNNFSYDENKTPDMPDKKWGVYVEEAIRYNYMLSYGMSVGLKLFATAAVPLGKTAETATFKPDALTEIGLSFTVTI